MLYSRLKSCEICFDRKRAGLHCTKHHFVCSSCISRYFTFHCQQKGILFTPRFKLPCPLLNCKSRPWRSVQVVSAVDSATLIACMDSTNSNKRAKTTRKRKTVVTQPQTLVQKVRQHILEALNVHCPSCRHVLDPSPDGCCAMSCPYCLAHFCWICFYCTPSASKAHIHVGRCPYVPPKERGNLFITNSTRQAAHRIHRIQNIREILWLNYSLEVAKHSASDSISDNVADGAVVNEPSFYERCFLFGAHAGPGGSAQSIALHPDIEELFSCSPSTSSAPYPQQVTSLLSSQVASTKPHVLVSCSAGITRDPDTINDDDDFSSISLVKILQSCDITVQAIFYEQLEQHPIMRQMDRSTNLPEPTLWHICCHNVRCACMFAVIIALIGGFVTAWVAIIAHTYEFMKTAI